jgi:hypothetical protein
MVSAFPKTEAELRIPGGIQFTVTGGENDLALNYQVVPLRLKDDQSVVKWRVFSHQNLSHEFERALLNEDF